MSVTSVIVFFFFSYKASIIFIFFLCSFIVCDFRFTHKLFGNNVLVSIIHLYLWSKFKNE